MEKRNCFTEQWGTRFVLFLYFRSIFIAFFWKCYCSVISSVRKIDYARVICIYGLYGNINYCLVTY